MKGFIHYKGLHFYRGVLALVISSLSGSVPLPAAPAAGVNVDQAADAVVLLLQTFRRVKWSSK